MCRFLAYKGPRIFMSDLLTRPEQSLILQSYKAREREEPLNGDGFGVGWYDHEIDPTPCVYASIRPAWSNRNLHRLSEKIRSTCFLAHVRAASKGSCVSELNCHPFQHGRFLWMHNGTIGGFLSIKRALRESLDDDSYNMIQGTTDSEHAFGVFLNTLGEPTGDYSITDLTDAMAETIQRILAWKKAAGVTAPSFLNFALTDGHNTVVSRFVSSPEHSPPTLYLSSGERLEVRNGQYRMAPARRTPKTAIVASEPLTAQRSDWQPVQPNHLLAVTPDLHIEQIPVSPA